MSTQEQPKNWSTSITKDGSFNRSQSAFRDFVSADGSTGFKAEPNRYHLYVSWACPWAHRTMIVRSLKGLEDVISYDVVNYLMLAGWTFDKPESDPNASTGDNVNAFKTLRELYLSVSPEYDRPVTVPVLWDKVKKTIVNNESSEIIRMLNSEFNEFAKNPQVDLYPSALRPKIDELNDWIYNSINNGVYKTGFAQKQEPYEEAFDRLFDALDRVEDILSKNRYLNGDTFTEADVRLWTTLVRFDPVYVGHFKCNKKRLIDYPNLWNYTREIYQKDQISKTVHMDHIKKHYMMSHLKINPFGIVSKGPVINFEEPHTRGK